MAKKEQSRHTQLSLAQLLNKLIENYICSLGRKKKGHFLPNSSKNIPSCSAFFVPNEDLPSYESFCLSNRKSNDKELLQESDKDETFSILLEHIGTRISL